MSWLPWPRLRIDVQRTLMRTPNLIDLAQRARLVLSQEQQDFLGKINKASVIGGIQMISPRWSPSILKPLPKIISRGRRS